MRCASWERIKRRRWQSLKARGQALVEFAWALPVLLLFLLGAIDLGRAFSSYEALANAAREGARYCALKLTASSRSERVTGEINGTVAGVTVSPNTCPPVAAGNPVTVTVEATFNPVTPLVQSIVQTVSGSPSITLQASATVMMTQ